MRSLGPEDISWQKKAFGKFSASPTARTTQQLLLGPGIMAEGEKKRCEQNERKVLPI
jgi:hypothetical protein